jgi:hypothetical protein
MIGAIEVIIKRLIGSMTYLNENEKGAKQINLIQSELRNIIGILT